MEDRVKKPNKKKSNCHPRERGQNVAVARFKEIITKNFPEPMRHKSIIQEAY